MNAYGVVQEFESRVAEYSGSKYALAVDCCTHAIFLSLLWRKLENGSAGKVVIPARTYVSVPMYARHAGYSVHFEDYRWSGVYELYPLNVFDGAKRFRRGMYQGGLHCLSFHIKKHLPIGRGGMILLDDKEAYDWLKKARYDGREGKPYPQEKIDVLGYHFYMQPPEAARGLLLLDLYHDRPDLTEDYPDLRRMPVFQNTGLAGD